MREKFILDLEGLFQKALAKDDLRSAIKVKELLGKACGFLPPSKPSPTLSQQAESLESLDGSVLDALIHHLSQKIAPIAGEDIK